MAQSPSHDSGEARLRIAEADDAEAIAAVYAPFVTDTIISFETTPPSADEMRRRIESSMERFPWLVCTRGDSVLGYAYASAYRSREAYQWSCECSVYVDPQHQGRGIGRALYASLFAVLAAQGYRNVYAGIARPNPGSESFHRACGFEPIGIYRKVGFKHDAWHDVAWMGLRLGTSDGTPTPIHSFADLRRDASIASLLATGERCLRDPRKTYPG